MASEMGREHQVISVGKSYPPNTSTVLSSLSPGGIIPYMAIGMCSCEGCGFGAVLSDPVTVFMTGGGGVQHIFWGLIICTPGIFWGQSSSKFFL